jgi:hypothetical protein
MVQDVLDRLVYLKEQDLDGYVTYLKLLKDLFPVDVVTINGVRIYNTKNKNHALQSNGEGKAVSRSKECATN